MTINERIAMCIEKSGLTKTAFAERINLSQPHVSKLANGTSAPSDRTIADICREFGISETWLRTGEGAMIVPTDRDAEIWVLIPFLRHDNIWLGNGGETYELLRV